MKLTRPARLLAVSLAMTAGAHAVPLTWDGNGNTPPNPDGGTGTWDANTTANWWDGAANVVWPAPGGTDDDAVFGNNAGTVSIAAGGVTANDLTFNTTGYLIQNNTLTLNGTTPTITTLPGISAAISSIIGGGSGLTKAGDGTLVLTGVNTYTGGTVISGGTLQLGAGTVQPTIHSTYAIGSGATLRIRHNTATGATAQTWAKYTGAGTLAFATGKNNDFGLASATLGTGFTGTLQIEGGRISLLAATGAGTNFGLGNAAKIVVTNGGHLGMWENTISLPTSMAFDIAGTGYGEAGFESAIRMGNGGATSTINGTVNMTDHATIGSQGTGVITGVISGGSATRLTIGSSSQTGAIALTGANTYSGPTTVNFGTLRIGNGGTTGSLNTASPINLNGGTLMFNRSNIITQGTDFASNITGALGAGALNQTGPGTLVLNTGNTYVGGTTIAAGTIQQGSANALPIARALTVNGTGVFDLNGLGASISTLGGAATGIVTDNAAGAGTSTLAITAGTSSAVIIKNGATRALALRVTNENLGFALTNAGNTFSGGIVLTGSAWGTRMSPGTITAGAYGTGAITVGESPNDLAGMYFSTATQTLSNPIISNTALGTDRVGTFRVDVAGITLSGQLTANLAPIAFSSNGTGVVNATGKITGSSGLSLIGNPLGGTSLTVNLNNAAGTNDYTGDTLINQNPQVGKNWTLALGAANQIPDGAGKGNVVILTNGTGVGRLNLGGFSETINGLSGNGTVDGVSGAPVLTVGGNNAHGDFSGNLANAAGSLALVKTGSGIQVLSGASTYGGGTSVNGGTLVAGNGSALGTNGAVSVAGSAVLAYRPSAAGALNLGTGTLSLASGSTVGGAVGGTASQSAITSSSAATTSGSITVDLNGIPGVAVTTGTNDLITAASGLDTATYSLGNIYNATNFTVNGGTLAATPGAVSIGVTSATALTTEHWKGGLSGSPAVWAISNGSTASNWASDASGTDTPLTPGTTATINFSSTGATNQSAMTLGASMSVAGIVVNSASPVGLNADGNALTIGSGGVTINGGAGPVTLGAAIKLGAAQSWANNSASPLTISGTVAGGGFVPSIGGSGDVTLSGSVSGTAGLTKIGSGSMTVTGVSDYTGPTTVSGGTLKLGGVGVIRTTSAVVFANTAGATLDLNGNNSYLGTLAGGGAAGGTVSLGASNLTLGRGAPAGNTTFSGSITGVGGSLTKVGVGTQILDGTVSNTYTGGTTVLQGALQLAKTGGATALGGNLIFDNNASPDVYTMFDNQFAAGTVASFVTDLGDHGRLELMGTTQTLAGIQTGGYMGAPRGVIQNREFGPANSGSPTLVLNGSGNYIYNGYLRSTGGVVSVNKNGTGTQTLVGNQIIHTGSTAVSNGALILQDTTAFASPITLSGTGTLNSVRTLAGFANRGKLFGSDTTASVTGTGVININNAAGGVLGGWTVVGRANALTMVGTININSGTFGRDNTSANNINTTATVNVAAGAVFAAGRGGNSIIGALNGAGDVGALWSGTSAGSLTLGNGGGGGAFSGTLRGNGNGPDGTLDGGIFSLIKIGAGTQSLSGASTYTGTTTVNGGVLQLDFATGGTTNILPAATPVVLGGGSLEIKGGSGEVNVQAVNGISGNGTIQLTQNGASSINVLLGSVGSGAINFAGSDATVGALGNLNFLTSTTTAGNNGTTRLGAHLWNGSGWASTSEAGGNHVVQWVGAYSDIYNGTTPGPVAIPSGNPAAEVRILEASGGYTNNTLGASETINSLLMSAGTTAATVDMGANTLTVGNGAAATGAVAISSGAQSLTIGTFANQGNLTSGTSGASSLALNNQAGSTLAVNSVIANNAGAGVVSVTADGSVVLNGSNTFTGTTTINSGTMQIGGAGSLGSGTYAGAIANSGTLRYSSSAAQTLSGVISGTGGVVKDTAVSTLILTAANTYSGDTTVSAGTVQLGNGAVNGTVTSGLYNVAAGATLYLNNATAVQAFTAGYMSRVRGAGTLRLNSAQTVTGVANWGPNTNTAIPIDSGFTGTLQVDNGRFDSSPAGLGGTSNMVFNANSQFLAWTGTYSQPFSIAGDGWGEGGQLGALRVAAGQNSVFNGNITLTANAGLNSQDGNSVMTINGVISGVGFNVAKHNGGLLVLNGANDYSGTTTINAGTLRLGTGGNTGSLNPASTITIAGGTLAFNRSDSITQGTHFSTAAITGAGGLTQVGPGTLTLNAANSYLGATTVTGGTLVVGDGGANGQLGAGAVTLSAGTTLSYNRTGAVTQAGALNSAATGAGTFNLNGDGTTAVSLNAGGNFSGTINLNGGALVGNATNPWGTGLTAPTFNIASGGVLAAGTASNHAHIGPLNLSGGIVSTAPGGTNSYDGENFQLNGDVTVTGTVPSTITRDGARTNANSGISLRGVRTFTVADVTGSSAADLLVSTELENTDNGTIALAGVGGIIKEGPGTMSLAGTHSYTGITTINAGTLNLESGSSVAASTLLTVNPGGTLAGTGTAGNVVIAGGVIAPGSSPGILATGNLTTTGAAAFNYEINGASAGTGYDQVQVTGLVNIGATSVFNFTASYIPDSVVDRFWLIVNDDVDPITGQFSGIPEGQPVSINGQPYYYTYQADSTTNQSYGGNDFALIPEPSGAVLLLLASAGFLRRRRK